MAKIEMTQNKNMLFPAILKRYNIFFCRIITFIVHVYMVQISLLTSSGKVVFLGGLDGIPDGHQREWKYLGHF